VSVIVTLQFTKLRTLPSTLYYNVSECRTSDDAELEVKLMLFYVVLVLRMFFAHILGGGLGLNR